MPEDFFNNEDDKQKLIESVSKNEPSVPKTNLGLFTFFKQTALNYAKNLNLKYNKVNVDEYQNLPKAEKIENTFVDRIEY